MSIGIIGGTGMNRWSGLVLEREAVQGTPFGPPSGKLGFGSAAGVAAVFLARHGAEHTLPPHKINYRANIYALREAGVRAIVAVAAVGGINPKLGPAAVAIPADLVDYTWGREHTYSHGPPAALQHAEFGEPYSLAVRKCLLEGAARARVEVMNGGVMAVTQGPRLESPAEIRRLKNDGCDMVGMTGMPEAGLAAELALPYASLAVSVNWAAGVGPGGSIHAEIGKSIEQGMARVHAILAQALPLLDAALPARG